MMLGITSPNSSRRPALLVLTGALLLLFTTVGCSAKQESDARVDRLIAVLQTGDWSEMQALSGSQLLADIDVDRFRVFSRIVQKLGPYQDRTMHSINVVNNRTEASYSLDFEAGDVSLDVVFVNGKLEGFDLTGSIIDEAIAEVDREGPL